MIYASAIYANTEHTMVTGTDSLGNTETVSVTHTVFRQPDDGPVGFVNNGGVIADYVEPEAPPTVLTPSLYAVANLGITAGDITGIETSVNFSAALYMDVGSYLLFFTETQANTNYLAKAYDDATRVRVTEKTTDYIAVTVTDRSDTPVDPAGISVEIVRVS